MVSAGFAARAMGITAFFGWMGMGLGGYLGGVFFDLRGDYELSFAFAMIVGWVNLIILSLFALYTSRVKRQQISSMD